MKYISSHVQTEQFLCIYVKKAKNLFFEIKSISLMTRSAGLLCVDSMNSNDTKSLSFQQQQQQHNDNDSDNSDNSDDSNDSDDSDDSDNSNNSNGSNGSNSRRPAATGIARGRQQRKIDGRPR